MSIPEKPGLFRALGQVMEIFLSLFRYTMQFIALLPMDYGSCTRVIMIDRRIEG